MCIDMGGMSCSILSPREMSLWSIYLSVFFQPPAGRKFKSTFSQSTYNMCNAVDRNNNVQPHAWLGIL